MKKIVTVILLASAIQTSFGQTNYSFYLTGKFTYNDVWQGSSGGVPRGVFDGRVEFFFEDDAGNLTRPPIASQRYATYDILNSQGEYTFNFSFYGDLSAQRRIRILLNRETESVWLETEANTIQTGFGRYSPREQGIVIDFNPTVTYYSGNRDITVSNQTGAFIRYTTLARNYVTAIYNSSIPFSLPAVAMKIDQTAQDGGRLGAFFLSGGPVTIDNSSCYIGISPTSVSGATILHEYGHFVQYKMRGNRLTGEDGCTNTIGQQEPRTGLYLKEGWAIFFDFAARSYSNRTYGDRESGISYPVENQLEDDPEYAFFNPSERFSLMTYATTDPQACSFACYLWNLYDNQTDSQFELSRYNNDNDDLGIDRRRVFETMRDNGQNDIDCPSKYHASYKSGLTSEQSAAVNKLYNYMFGISATPMGSAQARNVIVFSTQLRWNSGGYPNGPAVIARNVETGYRIYRNNGGIWQLVSTIPYSFLGDVTGIPVTYTFDLGVTPGEYRVTAYNSGGESLNPVTVNYQGPSLPPSISGSQTYTGTWFVSQNVTIESGATVNFNNLTLKLSPNASITVQQGASITATNTNFLPVTYSNGQRWGTLYLHNNNFSFNNCVFDFGGGNTSYSGQPMVYVASNGGVFQSCVFQNAIDRGLGTNITPSYQRSSLNLFDCIFRYNRIGFLNYLCNTYYLVRCTFHNNSGMSLYNSGTISEMGYSHLYANSQSEDLPAVENYGHLGMVAYYDKGFNAVINNYRTEIRNSNGAQLYVSVPWAQANSTIRDSYYGYGYNNRFIQNNNPYFTVPAQGVWWGGTPQTGMFDGSVDYSNALSYNPTGYSAFPEKDVIASTTTLPNASALSSAEVSTPAPNADARAARNAWLKQRMTQLRDELRRVPHDEQNARKLSELYGWVVYDRQNETNERDATLPVFAESENALKLARSGNRRASSALQSSGEVAMLSNLNWLIEEERYNDARAKLRDIESLVENKGNQLTLQMRKVTLNEQARRYSSALAALEQAKAISTELYPKEPNRLEIWESTLKWKMSNDTSAVRSGTEDVALVQSVAASSDKAKSDAVELLQNYPNPFNPSTVISYQLPVANQVSLKIYDMLGREVQTLVNEAQAAGRYSVRFNGANLASGTYFYKLQTGGFVQTKKLTLVK